MICLSCCCSLTSSNIFPLSNLLYTPQEHVLTVDSQVKELQRKDIMLSQLATEKAVMEGAVEAAKNTQTALERQITELKEEKTVIQDQLRSGGDSARVLDEYKKRAQMALKKVSVCLFHSYSCTCCQLCLFAFCKASMQSWNPCAPHYAAHVLTSLTHYCVSTFKSISLTAHQRRSPQSLQ